MELESATSLARWSAKKSVLELAVQMGRPWAGALEMPWEPPSESASDLVLAHVLENWRGFSSENQ